MYGVPQNIKKIEYQNILLSFPEVREYTYPWAFIFEEADVRTQQPMGDSCQEKDNSGSKR